MVDSVLDEVPWYLRVPLAVGTGGTSELAGYGAGALKETGMFSNDPNKAYDLSNAHASPWYTNKQYDPNAFQYGGYGAGPEDLTTGAQDWTNKYFGLGEQAGGNAGDLMQYGMDIQGRTGARENAELANRYNMAGADVQGSIDLARQAAMGQAPSEAEYMMQRGLQQAQENQMSQAASARGSAALANAQANANANIAQLQQGAMWQGGQLRAGEMANARNQYGGLAGQAQQSAMGRLGQGNQMAQYNRGANDQLTMGLLNAGLGQQQLGQGYYGMGKSVQDQQLQAKLAQQQMLSADERAQQNANMGVNMANTQAERDRAANVQATITGLGQTGLNAGMKGSKGPPPQG